MSLWIKPYTTSLAEPSTQIINNYAYGPKLAHAATHLCYLVGVTPGGNMGDYVGPINTDWQHIVITYDGTNIRAYRNNVLVLVYSAPGTVPPYPVDYYLAKMPNWDFYKGAVDDLRFYSRTLNASDVQNLYNL
jgi:hypothetical protein